MSVIEQCGAVTVRRGQGEIEISHAELRWRRLRTNKRLTTRSLIFNAKSIYQR